jgi:hypothetical protein
MCASRASWSDRTSTAKLAHHPDCVNRRKPRPLARPWALATGATFTLCRLSHGPQNSRFQPGFDSFIYRSATQRKPMCVVDVSTDWGDRAAGR